MIAIVPIVLHAPSPQERQSSASCQPASSSRPARWSSHSFHRSVPVPSRRPQNPAGGRAPPVTMIAGRSALAAPISAPGTVLSQLARSTTPSSGLARSVSSISIASRLR